VGDREYLNLESFTRNIGILGFVSNSYTGKKQSRIFSAKPKTPKAGGSKGMCSMAGRFSNGFSFHQLLRGSTLDISRQTKPNALDETSPSPIIRDVRAGVEIE
jgi:hypothetical protein